MLDYACVRHETPAKRHCAARANAQHAAATRAADKEARLPGVPSTLNGWKEGEVAMARQVRVQRKVAKARNVAYAHKRQHTMSALIAVDAAPHAAAVRQQ
jgi:hypothetical protein